MHLLDFYRAYPNFPPTLHVKSFYIDIRLGTLTTVIYSKLYKIDNLTRLPFLNEETRIFQKLSLQK